MLGPVSTQDRKWIEYYDSRIEKTRKDLNRFEGILLSLISQRESNGRSRTREAEINLLSNKILKLRFRVRMFQNIIESLESKGESFQREVRV